MKNVTSVAENLKLVRELTNMKLHTFRIEYKDGRIVKDKAEKAIDIIRKYDLCTRENLGYILYQED